MASSSVPASLLKQLSAASDSINNATDQFNAQVKTIEDSLASYNLGVSGWVPACILSEKTSDQDGNTYHYSRQISLGYQKENGKWCLMISSWIAEFEDYDKWIFRDAPRELRMEAIAGLPRLLEKLIEEANKLAEEVSKKTAEARTVVAAIKPKKGTVR